MNGVTVYRKEVTEIGEVFKGPKGPVTFGYQSSRNAFCLWFEAGQPMEEEFMVVGTGHPPAPEGFRLIASTVMPDGFYTFHLLKKES